MGVPKFFRWLSERYPAISQLIADNRIPEFDCLYLDMNGIIHNCTHKDAGEDVTFRLTEDEMFIRIFNYIEHLFGKIKPKQLFFMAIDGVAPRAKMNQQRARRFKTALEAEKAREEARAEGKELPEEPPFDSNCITPGTEFMAKLSRQLRYFVNKKVTEDSDWQRCEIVLSGHEVPGEGEHKIMEYIRNAKAQHSYNPNVRHCLYGLDADLIMLGLLSHDPHFCLLREEVKFGRNTEKSMELEHQNFYLLHLCIVREYLELEFQELKQEGVLSFSFDLERVIDDFILMGFFIGNDFLPNLPGIHINEGALAKMFNIYKSILPKSDGYLNEGGVINLKRLSLLLDGLSEDERERFEDAVSGEKWFETKQMEAKVRENGAEEIHQSKTPEGRLVITSAQRNLWKHQLRPYILSRPGEPLNLGPNLKAADRKFVQDLADTFHLDWVTKEDDDGHRNLIVSFPAKSGDDEDEEEGSLAANRVTRKYDNAMVIDLTAEDAKRHYEELYNTKHLAWKTKYYHDKFSEWKPEEYDTELNKMCENYVQGLQWVLYYYYRGIASWPWFYAYHYSPMTSDIVKGLGANLTFKKGNPFRPYEQLMGVLPDRSKSIVPRVYWDLMTNPDSPIIDFYPREFEQDLNGKKMDWEAVVKIPFIDERRLLAAMEPRNALLTEEEKARNGFGVALKFTFSPNQAFTYPSSLPGIFPDIQACQCIENIFDLPPTEGLEYRVGLMAGAKLSLEALAGFPSLHTLPFAATLIEQAGVCVFQSESRNPSMIVTLSDDTETRTKVEYNKAKLGKRCYVGYPFLQEAKIVKVSDELFDYTLAPDGSVIQTDHTNDQADSFGREARFLERFHLKRLGINIGSVECLITVDMLKGLMKTDEGAHVKEYSPNPSFRSVYASQAVVDDVISEDERFIERPAIPIEEEFPVGTRAFFLGEYAYGRPLEVQGHSGNRLEIMISRQVKKEPEFSREIIQQASRLNPYKPSFAIAKELNMHPLLLSKITSAFFINSVGGLRVNLGLNLKFDGKKQKVLGYSQKSNTGWEFSQAAIMLLANYITTFPDFFAALGRMPQNSDISHTDIWRDPAVAGQRVKEIGAWLKNQNINKFERVPLDAQQLDSIVVQKLAEAGGKVYEETAETTNKFLKGVPRSAILKPLDAELVLANQHFEVGDRVTYAAGVGKVPIASKGTVVGLGRTAAALLLDTLWDTTFMSGNTLGERAPPFRGQTVPSSAVINLTNRQVLSGSKAAMLRSVPTAASLTTLPTTVGITIFKDAPTPEPLARGWSSAASRGRNNYGPRGGHREDGPPSLQPSNLVYRPASNSPAPSGNHHPGSEGGPSARPSARGNRGGQGPRGANHRGPRPGASPSPRYNPHMTQGSGAYAAVPPPSVLIHDRGRGGRVGRGRGVFHRGGRGGNSDSSPAPAAGTAEG